MVRRSSRRNKSVAAVSFNENNGSHGEEEVDTEQQDLRVDDAIDNDGAEVAPSVAAGGRSVAAHVRDWQRRVAEREASRLARPEIRPKGSLGHADRKKSAVSSTPSGRYIPGGAARNEDAAAVVVQEEWCGPFSVARQMIAKREEARRKREAELEENENNGGGGGGTHPLDEAMAALENERKRKAHPSLQWKSKVAEDDDDKSKTTTPAPSTSIYAKRQKRQNVQIQGRGKVPSLFDLCVNFLVQNFEYVECLGTEVDHDIRRAIANELVEQNKLNADSFQALAEEGIEALELVDCAQVTQDQLSESLRKLIPAGLRYLVLHQSGRCFGPKTVDALVDAVQKDSENNTLFALSVGGAYLLKDVDAARMIQATARTITSLEFKACPLLKLEFCKSISQSFTPHANLMELALEDLILSDDCLAALVAQPEALKNVKSLSLARIEGLTDDHVAQFLKATGDTLERLDLCQNYNLTDRMLAVLRQSNPNLKALSLAGLKQLTAEGLEALFTHVPGMAAPPMLRSLDVSNCDHEALTDDVIQLVTQAATTRRSEGYTGNNSNGGGRGGGMDLVDASGGIVNLKVQASVLITDASLEYLVASSAKTLQQLDVSFCPKITDQGLGYLVDHCFNQLSRIELWGCAQITDDFLDGHRRANDPGMVIVGAWMKKNTSRTIR